METRPSTAVPYVPQAPVRAEAVQARGAVRTELSAPQAVTAQVGADQMRWQKSSEKNAEDPAMRPKSSITTDRETGDLVYQVLDPGTRAVLVQTPHESILKLRAYIHRVERQHQERLSEEHHAEIVKKEEADSGSSTAA